MEGSTLRGRKHPMKPAVSWHTTLRAKSSVLYLWQPWMAERGCSGQEQAISASHRTGGFCVLPDVKPRNLHKENQDLIFEILEKTFCFFICLLDRERFI